MATQGIHWLGHAMHWGSIVGSQKDVQTLRRLLPPGVELAVLTPEA